MYLIAQVIHFVIQPWHLCLGLVGLGLALLALDYRRLAKYSFWASGGLVALISLTPFADWLAWSLEDRIEPAAYDIDEIQGAIVLGGSTGSGELTDLRGVYLLTGSGERLAAIPSLRRHRPDLPIIVTGNPDEARITRAFLADVGVDPETIIFEDESRNTHENAMFSADMLPDPAGQYLLITSARHMPRSVGTFRQAGVDVIPYPVDYRALPPSWAVSRMNPTTRFELLDDVVDEWVGLVSYRLLGRTDALYPDD